MGLCNRHRWGGVVVVTQIRAFTEHLGVSQGAFSYWRKQLRRGVHDAHFETTPSLLSVSLVPDRSDSAPASSSEGRPFELLWPDGRRLCIPPDFDAQGLARLLAVLREAAC
jgi:hypothetical protein